jgi:hypothetical protein
MRDEVVRVLADEQAAWRRVATLVARNSPPEEVFAAVTEELGRLLDAEMTNMCRFEPDGTMIVIGSSKGRWHWPIGSRWPPADDHGRVVVQDRPSGPHGDQGRGIRRPGDGPRPRRWAFTTASGCRSSSRGASGAS